jgi:hypothetical protein
MKWDAQAHFGAGSRRRRSTEMVLPSTEIGDGEPGREDIARSSGAAIAFCRKLNFFGIEHYRSRLAPNTDVCFF